MENQIIKKARKLIHSSSVIRYIDIRDIEEQFKNIHIYETEEEFMDAYGYDDYRGERLEGFNRKNQNHLNPKYATPHTVIHEILHGLSSKFDKDGHRLVNGIQLDMRNGHEKRLNEGITDYLACKISGETPRHYYWGNYFFEGLDKILYRKYGDNDYLMDVYFNNRQEDLRDFIEKYSDKKAANKVFSEFGFMEQRSTIESLLHILNKNADKEIRREKIINRIKSSFGINKTEMLPQGEIKTNNNTLRDRHNKFIQENCYVENYNHPREKELPKQENTVEKEYGEK